MKPQEQAVSEMLSHFAEGLRSLAKALDILATADLDEEQSAAGTSEADWREQAKAKKARGGAKKGKADAAPDADTAAASNGKAAESEPIQKPVEKAPAKQAEKAISPDDFDAPEAEALATRTADDLKRLLVDFATKHGKDKAFDILGKYKAKKVADLAPEKIGEVYNAVQAGM